MRASCLSHLPKPIPNMGVTNATVASCAAGYRPSSSSQIEKQNPDTATP